MQTKNYPSQEKMVLIMADAIAMEPDGKFSLKGLLIGNEIYLPAEAPSRELALPSLGVMFVTRDGEGQFTGKIEIERPSGGILVEEVQASASSIVKFEYHLKATLFTPFPVPEFGFYAFRLRLDSRTYEFPIYIGNKAGHIKSTAVKH